jgi:hypothetical protein
MTDWVIVSPPSEGLPGQAQRVRDYTLTPGSTQVYNEGDIHSPRRRGPTRLLRIEVAISNIFTLTFLKRSKPRHSPCLGEIAVEDPGAHHQRVVADCVHAIWGRG